MALSSKDRSTLRSSSSKKIELINRSNQKFSQRVIKKDSQDSLLLPKRLQTEEYIFIFILLAGVLAIVGLINRRVENALLFALFISGIIIALFFALL
ncbi:hypothetical protein IQ255_13845 [Pleurocapsales cyanobacterium LEGE 10410]|nr:hypothetical protein [Pleurocapsales cyanobacterium LEGE 10410]